MPEVLLVAVVGAAAAAFIAWPLLRDAASRPSTATDRDAAEVRHRIALEELRDIEADHRLGSLEQGTYEELRAAAEERAAATRRALDAAPVPAVSQARPSASGRRSAAILGALIGAALIAGVLVPPPVGLAGRTVVNEPLAAELVAEEARQERIGRLLDRLTDDPSDTAALSDLADAYLAGGTAEDLQRAALVLQAVITLRPKDLDAHARLIGAYLRAGDYANAAAALESYEALNPDPADVAFFRGLIALNGDGDPAAAVEHFDRFLELAPDDQRAPMVRALREQAAVD
jgi:cytochrome c-type biogenesis protein CcmI